MPHFYDFDDDPNAPPSETTEALCRYAELLARHGPTSAAATAFFEAHRHLPDFTELAEESRRLEERFRPAPRPDGVLQRVQQAMPTLKMACVCLLVGAGAGGFAMRSSLSGPGTGAPVLVSLEEARNGAKWQRDELVVALETGAKPPSGPKVVLLSDARAWVEEIQGKRLRSAAEVELASARVTGRVRVEYPESNEADLLQPAFDDLKASPTLAALAVFAVAREKGLGEEGILVLDRLGRETTNPMARREVVRCIEGLATTEALKAKGATAIANVRFAAGVADVFPGAMGAEPMPGAAVGGALMPGGPP